MAELACIYELAGFAIRSSRTNAGERRMVDLTGIEPVTS